MRLACHQKDYWELRSGEESHANNPEEFWIPSLEQRQNIKRGQAARLIFDIESVDENDQVVIQGERMWTIVAEKIGDYYIGILDNQPASFEPIDNIYLCFGAEILFLPEHIIDIADPPQDYVDWQLSQPPERKWPRD